MILSVYVDDRTARILTFASREADRSIEELAEAAVEEAALGYLRDYPRADQEQDSER